MEAHVEISDTLYDYLMKMDKQDLLNTMLNAVDIMQAWNGKSVTASIMIALGADEIEDDNGNLRWVLKKK